MLTSLKQAILPLFLFVAGILTAQSDSCNFSLSGKVIDSDTKEVLEFAEISIVELKTTHICTDKGEYTFNKLCRGTYTVKVMHVGCEPLQFVLTITGNTEKTLKLPHHLNELKQVTIVEKKAEEKHTQVKDQLEGVALQKTKGQSLGEALKSISGVTSIQTGASISKPVIHGLHSNRILILNNGIRQEGQQWGSEHAPEIDPFIANKLTVLKGANGVRYGSDAIAGVILVEPKDLRDSAGIAGEVNMVGSSNGRQGVLSATVDGNLKKLPPLSWRLQGTLKRGGNIQTPTYYLKNTGSAEYNFSGALGFNKENFGVDLFYSQFNTTIAIFYGSHIGNLTDLQQAFELAEPKDKAGFTYKIDRPYQHIEHELTKVKGFIRTGNIGKLNITYGRQYNLRNEYDKDKPLNDSIAALNHPDLQYEITTHTADIVWEHNKLAGLTGSVGISGMQQKNTYDGRLFIPFYKNYNTGVFCIEHHKTGKWEFEAGARFDYKHLDVYLREKNGSIVIPTYNYANSSFTLGAIYSWSDHLSLSINGGKAWRAPGVNELYSNGLHHGAAAVEIGNKNLLPEQAYNFIANVNYRGNKRVSGELSMYHNRVENYIYLSPQLPPTLTIKGAFPTFAYKQTNATFTGVDLSWDVAITQHISIVSKSSLLRAFNKTEDTYLILMPSDRTENSLNYRFANGKYVSDSYFAAGVMYVAKQTRVPENADFAPAPGDYTLLTIDAGCILHVQHQKIKLGISVGNLLNTTYRDYMDRFRYYCNAMGRNVTVRLKIPLGN
jgi:iron complex outermembrane recepter protein